MAGPKRDEAKSILSYVRQELRYMDEDLRNDGLLPELSSLRSVYEQLSTLLELSDGRRKKKEKPEFPEDKKKFQKAPIKLDIFFDTQLSIPSSKRIYLTLFYIFIRKAHQYPIVNFDITD